MHHWIQILYLKVYCNLIFNIVNNLKLILILAHGYNCYREFKTVICLEVVVRQQMNLDPEQKKFIELLPRVRNGLITEDDWKFLLTRESSPLLLNQPKFKSATRLFYDRNSVLEYNNKKLIELRQPIVPLISKHSKSCGKSLSDDLFYGLPKDLYLSVEAKVVLTSNLWTNVGLVNGANGVVRDIIYPIKSELNILETLPDIIFVDFESYSGPAFFREADMDKIIPIYKLQTYNRNFDCTREQFPLKLNYAMTIHKSQGSTLSSGVIDLGKSELSLGLGFVALSRFKSIHDFVIEPITFQRLLKINNHKSLPLRLNEEKRLNKLVQLTKNKYSRFL